MTQSGHWLCITAAPPAVSTQTHKDPGQPTSVLWTAQAKLALSAKNIAIEIGDPLPTVRRDVEVTDRALDMRRYTAPIELRIEIGEIGWRSIAELLVHPNFFKFVIKRIGLAQIMRIAELA